MLNSPVKIRPALVPRFENEENGVSDVSNFLRNEEDDEAIVARRRISSFAASR